MKLAGPVLRVLPSGVAAAVVLLGLACGSSRLADGRQGVDPSAGVEETVPKQSHAEIHEGTLARTVEAGGWILREGEKEYLLLSTYPYRDQSWFREGVRVEVRGREDPSAVTIYMQGTPFRVSAMKPVAPAPRQPR